MVRIESQSILLKIKPEAGVSSPCGSGRTSRFSGFIIRGSIMKRIDISTKKYPNVFTMVNDKDFEWLSRYKWYAEKNRNIYYARTAHTIGGKQIGIRMHRLILNPPAKLECDHRNGNGLDNRRCNLRICTQAQNQANRKYGKLGVSKYRGVAMGGNKWVACIGAGCTRKYLGAFDNEIDAAKAYDVEAKNKYGEFAQLNFSAGILCGSGG